jgi:hypothetical protein
MNRVACSAVWAVNALIAPALSGSIETRTHGGGRNAVRKSMESVAGGLYLRRPLCYIVLYDLYRRYVGRSLRAFRLSGLLSSGPRSYTLCRLVLAVYLVVVVGLLATVERYAPGASFYSAASTAASAASVSSALRYGYILESGGFRRRR